MREDLIERLMEMAKRRKRVMSWLMKRRRPVSCFVSTVTLGLTLKALAHREGRYFSQMRPTFVEEVFRLLKEQDSTHR